MKIELTNDDDQLPPPPRKMEIELTEYGWLMIMGPGDEDMVVLHPRDALKLAEAIKSVLT